MEGLTLDIQDGGREPGTPGPAPGRQAESRQGRSTVVYWQHKQRRRWRRRQAPSRAAVLRWGRNRGHPGLCQRLTLGDLREEETTQPRLVQRPNRPPPAPPHTRASMYSILRSSAVSFSFSVASRDRHDMSVGRRQ